MGSDQSRPLLDQQSNPQGFLPWTVMAIGYLGLMLLFSV